jgi:L-lactate dehydrogenase complex protein LldF
VSFPKAASVTLRDSQLRRNLAKATTTIRGKREAVVSELPDWQELRAAGRAIKDFSLVALDRQLSLLEAAVVAAGGRVHWANDGNEGCSIVADIVRSHGVSEVVKVKSIATDEIRLNEALASAGVRAVETDLAELIIQLGDDMQSHILVPAIHKNRAEIRELFARELDLPDLTDEPAALAEAARLHLRRKFLSARVGISGANFAVAETGTVSVFESEGNGRMCTTLPEVLVTVMGIEKVVPSWRDMEVFLQLLPRSSTGERMNPYTSFWTGVRPGDGPQEFHLVLLDNGRTGVLADQVGRQALRCIRCSACLNVCPVYSRTGGHAYESVYPGPIGAILSPQLTGLRSHRSLPYASSLCGACYEVCPVEIDIPRVLVHLRSRVVDSEPAWKPEKAAMKAMYRAFSSARSFERAQRAARLGSRPLSRHGRIGRLPWPLSGWSATRDLLAPPKETFRDWWRRERGAPEAAPKRPPERSDLHLPRIARSTQMASKPGEPRDARGAILARIEMALKDRPEAPDIPRTYRRSTTDDRALVIARFSERVGEYKASVRSASPAELQQVLRELCNEAGAERLAIPEDLAQEWRPEGVELVPDRGMSPHELDTLDGALTTSTLGIAETGTIVLTGGGEGQGRRALSLVPDYHVCIVEADTIVATVPEAIERLEPAVKQGRPLTFIAGPSATSDIELNRVEGVHGPRTLHVVVVG